jgi:tRNA threonylcarbamoyladenosine biosynthesis protein TsaE
LNLTLTDSGTTDLLGRALAQAFPGASAAAVVVYLQGELGAGKTTCARSLIHALGFHGTVRSPTYTLVETYGLPGLTCVHADLYRLRTAQECADLGLSEYLSPGHLVLIEWSENGGSFVPDADLRIALGYAGAGRRATLTAGSRLGDQWLKMLAHDSRLIPYLSNLT